MTDSIRVQFIHGLESSPGSTKARLFAEHFEATTPAMDTRDLAGCIEAQARALLRFRPTVLVASSFGAIVAVELLRRGAWRGPTLLLAQAARRHDPAARLPTDEGIGPVWIVHGTSDDIVDPQDSRDLAATGDPRQVRLIEVDDDHPLRNSVRNGALVEWIVELAAPAGPSEPALRP